MDETAPGTLISNKATAIQFKAIAAKDNIIAINIKSSRMLLAYGFMRKIFEVFEKYKTPIDMVTTSEVAVSVTIDDDRYLSEIEQELQGFGVIEVDANMSIVSIVGNRIAEREGVLRDVFAALGNLPVRMVSFGGSHNNISLLLPTSRKGEALQALNSGLFHL